MRIHITLLSLLLSIIAISEVQAVGFDCSKAETTREKLICSDKELSDAVKMLDKEYKAALRTYPYKKELKINQDNWAGISEYEPWDTCTDAPCLLRLYRERIALIRAQYSTYFYGGDKFTGEYRYTSKDETVIGQMSVRLIPGSKIKFFVRTTDVDYHLCELGEDGNAIATFTDKNHAVFVDDDAKVDECVIILTFDKKKVKVETISGCVGYCGHGYLDGVYIKISKKPELL